MNFLIKIHKSQGAVIHEFRNLDILIREKNKHRSFLYCDQNYMSKFTDRQGNLLFWIGDCIPPSGYHNRENFLNALISKFQIDSLVFSGGFFYCIRINKSINKSLEIYNSFLSILPIYYYEAYDHYIVSSSAFLIATILDNQPVISKRFMLEKLLFNYPLSNISLFREINLVPSNCHLEISGQLRIVKNFEIKDWFNEDPYKWEKSKEHLINFSIQRIRSYCPDDLFFISFTSGFDSRTLVSTALYHRKNFETYSFGIEESKDIQIPKDQVKHFNIIHNSYYLDANDHLHKCLQNGLELVKLSEATANFARSHYVWAVKQIAKKSGVFMTGNFGSELFRAFHNTGVVVSPLLYYMFAEKNLMKITNNLEKRSELSFINKDIFKDELQELKDYLNNEHKKINPNNINKSFYLFIFNEVFRKYFGAEIKMQLNYALNRSPFIDPELVKEVLKTEVAGIYSKFYENNPLKRLKGQLFYAEVMKRTCPTMLKLKTGRGYGPGDLLTRSGKIKIALSYLHKKTRTSQDADSFGVDLCLQSKKEVLRSLKDKSGMFKLNNLSSFLHGNSWQQNQIINVVSFIMVLNELEF